MTDRTHPDSKRHVMTQSAHARWNARNYPGTRQLCCACDQPTGRCEEDAIYIESNGIGCGPLCEECYTAAKEKGND